jgi:hypothetical protein
MVRSNSTSMSLILLLLLVACVQLPATAQEEKSSVNSELLNRIIQHMEEAQLQNRAQVRPYSVTRDYLLYGNDPEHIKGHIVAKVNFLPPNQKSYNIAESTGGFQEKVVRRVLDHEVDVTRDPQDTYLTSRNYDFQLLGEQQLNGRRCYLLRSHPKRSDKNLMKANLWVDAESFRILRLEGEPNKNPSFWVKDVHITLDFGDVSGMWLQTHTRATARVRFAGDYKMYSHDMRYETAPVVASASAHSTSTPSANTPATAAPAITPGRSTVLTVNAVPVRRARTMRHTVPLLAGGVLNSR